MARGKTYFVIFLFVLALKNSFQDLVDHEGSEFILSFISQHPSPTHKFAGNNNLYLSTFEDVHVRVQIPFLKQQWDKQYDMRAGDTRIIKLPGNLRTDAFTGKEKKGIRIIANSSLSVHGLQELDDKGEGFLGLPVDVLGKDYIVPTYPPVVSSIVQVVAKEDNTQVWFKLRLPEDGRVMYGTDNVGNDQFYKNGDFINVTLNDLEVFQVQGDDDLSGTSVTSSKPIAVFSGNDCAMVPRDVQPCNHLVEQIPPVSVWGMYFIASPTPNRNSGGDEFHVLASKDNTNVQVDWNFKKTLSKGETYQIQAPWNKSLEISTSNPSLVVQYTNGSGSPSMSIMPPKHWSSNDYRVYVASGVDGYMNVVIDTRLRSGLRVKGPMNSVPMNWKTLAGGLSQVSLHLSQSGIYYVYHDSPLANFTSVMYGMTSKKLYSFPAGFKWELPIDPSCSKTSTQGGDEKDNDCDGVTDEELANGIDDDGDGEIDEDLITPPPKIIFPNDYVSPPLLSCGHQSSNVADPRQQGFHPISGPNSAQGMCYLRGKTTTISNNDNVGKKQGCYHEFNRVWTVKDACQNKITHTQHIAIITPDDPQLSFPADVNLFCRDKKYLQPEFIGEVLTDGKLCSRNVTITHKDTYSGDCSSHEAQLKRVWMVDDKCRKTIVKTQVIKLMPKGSKRTNNYVTQFSITSQKFSAELADRTSTSFKRLAANLENEMEETLRLSKLGKFFVEAKVLGFSNGSVITSILVKMDMQAHIGQQNLLYVMNDTLSSGTLGPYQVDPSSIGIKDFNECAAPDLNKCHAMAKCTNTVGSYNCTCVDGYFGDGFLCQAPPTIFYADPPIVSGTEENVTLTCQARGLPEPTFTWITPDGHIVNATKSVYEIEILDDDSQRKRGKEIQEDGSLLVFDTRTHDQGIYKCIAINIMGQAERSVNLTVREDIVEVSAAITLEEEVFNEELENKSSARYQEMEKNVKQELTALFQDIEGFERVDILGFVNGSVKVRFRVVVKVDKIEEKKPLVIAKKIGKTLRVSVQNGEIGSLKVKKTVELREVPPPPVNVQSSDVKQTEAIITWSHPELYDMYAISGYLLQFRKFGTKKWKLFATTRGENHRLTSLEHGTAYSVRLKSENEFGRGISSESLELQTEKKASGAMLAIAIVIPLLLLVILAIVAVFVYRRWQKKKRTLRNTQGMPMHPLMAERSQPDAATERFVTFGHERYAPVPSAEPNGASAMPLQQASFAWREIPRDRVILGKVLGEGEFGMVVQAEFTEDDGHITHCAVKKLKRTATESDYKDLLNELEIMTSVRNHPNLVNLIGACSIGGPLMILVEFAEHGSLLRYLRERRKQNYEDMNEYSLDISSAERLKIACDVADGMKHLAAMKCAHRDLAARNILLGEGMVAKVSDFGLSRDIYTDNVYEKKSGGKLPAKWMAVESLEQGIYTSQSDVWSFGVLLWEIETGGCAPYAGMVVSELLTKIKAGSRLEKPRYCTDSLYTVMLGCWDANPKKRPTFEELSDELHRMHRQETDYLAPEDYRLEPNYENTSVENVSSA